MRCGHIHFSTASTFQEYFTIGKEIGLRREQIGRTSSARISNCTENFWQSRGRRPCTTKFCRPTIRTKYFLRTRIRRHSTTQARSFTNFFLEDNIHSRTASISRFEYYRNMEGLSKSEWNQWMKFVKFQNGIQQGSIPVPPEMIGPSRDNLLWALQTLSPRGTMRDYLFGREYYSDGSWSFEFIQLMNGDDASVVLVPTVSYRISEFFSRVCAIHVVPWKE